MKFHKKALPLGSRGNLYLFFLSNRVILSNRFVKFVFLSILKCYGNKRRSRKDVKPLWQSRVRLPGHKINGSHYVNFPASTLPLWFSMKNTNK